MPLNLEPGIRQALVEALTEALSTGSEARLPGFGTLRVVQQSAEVERDSNGGFRLRPPRRRIEFTSEHS